MTDSARNPVDNGIDSSGIEESLLERSPASGDNWRNGVPENIRNEPCLSRFKDVAALAKSYVAAQKLIGAERIAVPKGEDEASWEQLYDRLGRPATPEEYKLNGETTVKVDPYTEMWFRNTAHQIGLSEKQAVRLKSAWEEMVQARGQVQAISQEEAQKLLDHEMRQEWGSVFEQKHRAAMRAVHRFADGEVVSHLEALMGSKSALKFFSAVGEAISEDRVEGSGKPGFKPDPAEARAQLDSLHRDTQATEALLDRDHPRHTEYRDLRRKLYRHAYPEE